MDATPRHNGQFVSSGSRSTSIRSRNSDSNRSTTNLHDNSLWLSLYQILEFHNTLYSTSSSSSSTSVTTFHSELVSVAIPAFCSRSDNDGQHVVKSFLLKCRKTLVEKERLNTLGITVTVNEPKEVIFNPHLAYTNANWSVWCPSLSSTTGPSAATLRHWRDEDAAESEDDSHPRSRPRVTNRDAVISPEFILAFDATPPPSTPLSRPHSLLEVPVPDPQPDPVILQPHRRSTRRNTAVNQEPTRVSSRPRRQSAILRSQSDFITTNTRNVRAPVPTVNGPDVRMQTPGLILTVVTRTVEVRDRDALIAALAEAASGHMPAVPLTSQPSIQRAMQRFINGQFGMRLHHCPACKEVNFVSFKVTSHASWRDNNTCDRCSTEHTKIHVYNFGHDNSMDPEYHDDPEALAARALLPTLAPVEEMAISLCAPVVRVTYLKRTGTLMFDGNCINFLQDITTLCTHLPSKPSDLPIINLRRRTGDAPDDYHEFKVRRWALRTWIQFLIRYSKWYHHIQLSEDNLQLYPDSVQGVSVYPLLRQIDLTAPPLTLPTAQDMVANDISVSTVVPPVQPLPLLNSVLIPSPLSLHSTNDSQRSRTVDTGSQGDRDDDPEDVDAGGIEDGPTTREEGISNVLETGVIGGHVPQQLEAAAVVNAIRATANLVDYPPRAAQPLRERDAKGLFAMSFPTLFPFGTGDPTDSYRLRSVTLKEGCQHLLRYAVFNTDPTTQALQQYIYPFATHIRFSHYAQNMIERQQALGQASYFLKNQGAYAANMSLTELQHIVRDPRRLSELEGKISRFAANLYGSPPWLNKKRKQLEALISQKKPPTLWFTLSFPNHWWDDLHRVFGLAPTDAEEARKWRARNLNLNPAMVDEFFVLRVQIFLKELFSRDALNSEWYWCRNEWQQRDAIHTHGTVRLTSDPGLTDLGSKVVTGRRSARLLRANQHIREDNTYEGPDTAAGDDYFLQSFSDLLDNVRLQPLTDDQIVNFQGLVDAGILAEQQILVYRDYLLTTMNDLQPLPPDASSDEREPPIPPTTTTPHPCSCCHHIAPNYKGFIPQMATPLANVCQRHRCTQGYCTANGHCRFKYPHKLSDISRLIVIEKAYKAGDNKGQFRKVSVELITKTNDRWLNSFCSVALAAWGGNVDFSILIDYDMIIQYIAKYVTKLEQNSLGFLSTYRACINNAIENERSPRSALLSLFNKVSSIGAREHGRQEIGHLLKSLPIVITDQNFIDVNLLNDKTPLLLTDRPIHPVPPVNHPHPPQPTVARQPTLTGGHLLPDLTALPQPLLPPPDYDHAPPPLHEGGDDLDLSHDLLENDIYVSDDDGASAASAGPAGAAAAAADVPLDLEQTTESLTSYTLVTAYARRYDLQWLHDRPPDGELEDMSLHTFCKQYTVGQRGRLKNTISARGGDEPVIVFLPQTSKNTMDKIFHYYYTLVKYVPWRDYPERVYSPHNATYTPFIEDQHIPATRELIKEAFNAFMEEGGGSGLLAVHIRNRISDIRIDPLQNWTPLTDRDDDVNGEDDVGAPYGDEEDAFYEDLEVLGRQVLLDDDDPFTIEWTAGATWVPSALQYPAGELPNLTDVYMRAHRVPQQGLGNDPMGGRPRRSRCDLRGRQIAAFDIICHAVDKARLRLPFSTKKFILLGRAGSGKSFVVDAFRTLYGSAVSVVAFSGKAAANVGGKTLHSMDSLKIPVDASKSTLSSTQLASLQANFRGVKLLLIDEYSMLSSSTLHWVDRRTKEATGIYNVDFGGLILVLIGDPAQLPTVTGRVLWDNNVRQSADQMHGHTLYKSFKCVIKLQSSNRLDVASPHFTQFSDFLESLRQGSITVQQWHWFVERTSREAKIQECPGPSRPQKEEQFKLSFESTKSSCFFNTNAEIDKHNLETLRLHHQSTGQPIARLNSNRLPIHGFRGNTDQARQLQPILYFSVDSIVYNLWNTCVPYKISNGTCGVIRDIIYLPDKLPPSLPTMVVVEFPDYSGPPIFQGESREKYYPILQETATWYMGSTQCSIQQIPLRLHFATSPWKCQGGTYRDGVCLRLGDKEVANGVLYVQITRVTRIEQILMDGGCSFERLTTAITTRKGFKERIKEEQRLDTLSNTTFRQYDNAMLNKVLCCCGCGCEPNNTFRQLCSLSHTPVYNVSCLIPNTNVCTKCSQL